MIKIDFSIKFNISFLLEKNHYILIKNLKPIIIKWESSDFYLNFIVEKKLQLDFYWFHIKIIEHFYIFISFLIKFRCLGIRFAIGTSARERKKFPLVIQISAHRRKALILPIMLFPIEHWSRIYNIHKIYQFPLTINFRSRSFFSTLMIGDPISITNPK